MLHQTLSKGWCRDGSGLLLGLIVRPRGRLVEAGVLLGASENRSARPAHRLGGHDACDPRSVAPLPQRARLLAFRFLSPALLLPEPLLPEPVQPQGASPREPEMRALQRAFARGLARPSAVYRVLDTTLLPAIVRVRASEASKGLFCGQASFGRSASKTEWVYGFKVALVVDPEGVVSAFGLAPAASDERPIGEALIAEDLHDAYLADKGFTGIEWERRWLEVYGALVAATPYDDSRRAWSQADRRWASGKRQIIEGVIGQLKDFFSLERHRAKTLGGLLTRLAAKVAAYTCAQRINYSLDRPLRHLADLLV
jgi:Transposase DDE domain